MFDYLVGGIRTCDAERRHKQYCESTSSGAVARRAEAALRHFLLWLVRETPGPEHSPFTEPPPKRYAGETST